MIIKNLYKRAIERFIIYGCEIRWDSPVFMRHKTIQIQRIPLLAITGCFKTTSTVAMQVLAGVASLDILLDNEIEKIKMKKRDKVLTSMDGEERPVPVEKYINRLDKHPTC